MSTPAVRHQAPRRATPLAWAILGLGVFAYAIAVLNRASLGVAALEAQERLHASASELALFSVLQLGVYALMQVPVGVFLDRHGPRVLISGGLLVMAFGQAWLAVAESVSAGVGARMLVGAGDAMTFISVIRAATNWFPPSSMPAVTQATAIVGQCGQLAATYPLIALLAGLGWSATFLSAAGVTFTVCLLVVLLLRDAPAGSDYVLDRTPLRDAWSSCRRAWAQDGTRLGFCCHFTVQFAGMLFVLIWGYPFLVEGQGLTPELAGALLASMVPAGIVIGFALGRFSGTHPHLRLHLVSACLAGTVVAWSAVIIWPASAPTWLLVVLVVALSSNVPASMIGLDIARAHNPPERLGMATGITNSAGFFAALIAIFLIGVALDLLSNGASYRSEDFRIAMSTQYIVWGGGALLLRRAHLRVRTASDAPGRGRSRRVADTSTA